MNNAKKDSFVFYRSFQDAINGLDESDQLIIYRAIANYALDKTEPNLERFAKVVFTLIKPQIDANWRKHENGKKGAKYGKLGGAPKGNKNATKQKQPLNNGKTTPNVNENVNVNVNENVCVTLDNNTLTQFERFNLWIKENTPNLLKIEEQLTEKQLDDLVRVHTPLQITDLLKEINNKKGEHKYRNLYETLKIFAKHKTNEEYKPSSELRFVDHIYD